MLPPISRNLVDVTNTVAIMAHSLSQLESPTACPTLGTKGLAFGPETSILAGRQDRYRRSTR